jgi:hypothetical protein
MHKTSFLMLLLLVSLTLNENLQVNDTKWLFLQLLLNDRLFIGHSRHADWVNNNHLNGFSNNARKRERRKELNEMFIQIVRR